MEYFESSAFGKWCKRVYGNDMKQLGMVTIDELELFYHEVKLPQNSHILDMGCGPGCITAAISEHYKSFVIGIDINKEAIEHAKKTFSNNTALDFKILDGNEIDYEAESFDLIYFFDTLYFTHSIERLRPLLDKCYKMLKQGGKLVVFWTNYPNKLFNIFDMSVPMADNTQVGIWGIDNHVQFKAFSLTESHRMFWLKALMEIKAMGSELDAEIPEHYKKLLDECIYFTGFCEKGDAGGLFRWLYVFNK